MKIFQTFQSYFEFLGFTPNQSLQSHPFNRRIAIGFLIQSLTLTIELIYIFQGSHSLMEYSQLFYMIGVTIMNFIMFLFLSFQMQKPFQLIIAIGNLCDGKWKNRHFMKTKKAFVWTPTIQWFLCDKYTSFSEMRDSKRQMR